MGVSEALDIALRAVLNPGDKVLYHEPCYVSYMPSIKLTHAEPIGSPLLRQINSGSIRIVLRRLGSPVVGLILNFPTNPTGGVTEKAKLEKLAKFAVEKISW